MSDPYIILVAGDIGGLHWLLDEAELVSPTMIVLQDPWIRVSSSGNGFTQGLARKGNRICIRFRELFTEARARLSYKLKAFCFSFLCFSLLQPYYYFFFFLSWCFCASPPLQWWDQLRREWRLGRALAKDGERIVLKGELKKVKAETFCFMHPPSPP